MLPTHLRSFIQHNVLTSLEAAEILKVSRQRVTALVKEGELKPIKSTSQGMLFFRADVEGLKNAKELGYIINKPRNMPLYDGSGTTKKSIEFFKDNMSRLDQISEIYIYYDEIDAAIDKFYIESDFLRYGELRYVETPYMIIKSENGTEIWLGGCNCGYGGEGPRGARTILNILKESGKLKGFDYSDEDLRDLLFNQVVKIIVERDSLEIFKHDSMVNGTNAFSTELYLFRNQLVLTQDPDTIWSRQDKYPLEVLQKYRAFIPNPEEVTIFQNDDQAIQDGYFGLSYVGDEVPYRVIIRDASGRQLWLKTSVSTPLQSQQHLREVLELCGFEIPEEPKDSIPARLFSWWNTSVIKVPPMKLEPLHLRKKKIKDI